MTPGENPNSKILNIQDTIKEHSDTLSPKEIEQALREFINSKKEKEEKTENSSKVNKNISRLEAEDPEEGNYDDYINHEMGETSIAEFNPEPNNNISFSSVGASEEHNQMMKKIISELNNQEKIDILENLGEEEKTIYNNTKRFIENSSMNNDEIGKTLSLLRDLLEGKISSENFFNNLPNESEFNKVIEHYESDLNLSFEKGVGYFEKDEDNSIDNEKGTDIMKSEDVIDTISNAIYSSLKSSMYERVDIVESVSENYIEIAKKYGLDYDYRTEFFNSIEDMFPNESEKIFDAIATIQIQDKEGEYIDIDLEKLIGSSDYSGII